MAELYIFSQDDKLLTTLSDSTGLIEAPIEDLLNQVSDEPFLFTVEADSGKAKYVVERNRVVFKDRAGDFREFVIDELNDTDDNDGSETEAICIPAWQYELQKNLIEDRRFTDREAQFALDAALENTRYIGKVEVNLGKESTNFYRLESSNAIWKIMEVWGGEFKDTIDLNNKGRIKQRNIILQQRRGADEGARFEIDHNMESIERTLISDPITATYGWGASLETEDEEGNATGGHTRYIDFKDVEWSVAKGDPVDKPKGQAWVGDPDALEKYGLEHEGKLLHLYDQFSNQDYEDPEELLMATWEHLQKNKDPEVNYKMSVDLLDKPVSLGDTAQGIDRQFARPIEVQSRIISLKYDVSKPDDPAIAEMGQFLSLSKTPGQEIDDLRNELNDTRGKADQANKPINKNKYPDKKPSKPINVHGEGSMEVIQLYWDYTDELYVRYYEVYGSQQKDFVADSQHLLWKGDVSAFAHNVDTDQTWYYYVRAVNYHDRPSDFSDRVKVSTRRVLTDDILFSEDMAEHLRELNRISDIIGEKGINLDHLHEDIPDYMKQQAKEYTDKEIKDTKDDLMDDLADKAGVEWVEDQLIDKVDYSEYTQKVNDIADDIAEKVDGEWVDGRLESKADADSVYRIEDIDDKFDNVVSITEYRTDVDGFVDRFENAESRLYQNEKAIGGMVEQSDYDDLEKEINKRMTEWERTADGFEQSVSDLRSNIDDMEFGGRNLLRYTDFNNQDNIDRLVTSGFSRSELRPVYYEDIDMNMAYAWVDGTEGDRFRVFPRPYYELTLREGKTYTLSWYAVTYRLNRDFDYSWVFVDGDSDFRLNNIEGETVGYTSSNIVITKHWTTFKWNRDTTQKATVSMGGTVTETGKVTFAVGGMLLERSSHAGDWKPNPEDTNSLINDVREYTSSVEQKADSIIQDVESLEMDISDHKSWIKESNTKFEQYDDNFKQVVYSKEYTKDMDDVVDRLNLQNTAIEQNEKGILNRVEKDVYDKFTDSIETDFANLGIKYDEISATVSNIRIGGRNILRNTDFTNEVDVVTVGFSSSELRPLNYDGFDLTFAYAYLTDVDVGDRLRVQPRPYQALSLSSGETYTLSWYAYTTRLNLDFDYCYITLVDDANLQLNDVSQEHIVDAKTSSGDKRSIYRYTTTFTFDRDSTDSASVMIGATVEGSGAVNLALSGIQLESGTMASDWQPSEKDMDQRMSVAETSIEQTARKIDLKVNVDEIVSEINLKKEGIRIAGDLIHLDGLTLIDDAIIQATHIANASIEKGHLKRAIIDDAHIDELTGKNFVAHSINADRLNVAKLSSVSADLGTVTAGTLESDNNNMRLNLNTGNLTMRHATFKLGGGGKIDFTDVGNRIKYKQFDDESDFSRSAGLGIGRSINNRFPYVFMGTTGNNNLNPRDEDYFSGFIANTQKRETIDDIGNSVVGYTFHIRDSAVKYEKGFNFDLNGSNVRMYGMNTGDYNYHLGRKDNQFSGLYLKGSGVLSGADTLRFRNSSESYRDQGFAMELTYGDDEHLVFRGSNSDEYYNLGKPGFRFSYVYLKYQPKVSSDESVKDDIKSNDLGLSFIMDVDTKKFKLESDRPEKEPTQYGIVAQQLLAALGRQGLKEEDISLVTKGSDGIYDVEYTQLIAPTIKAVQDIDKKFTNEVTRLEGKTKDNTAEIQMLKARIKQLEESA